MGSSSSQRGAGAAEAELPFSRPVRAPGELEAVERALASGATQGDGPFTAEASRALSALLGGAPVLLTTSGTHALELSALLLELGPDDEVLLPSFTFSSTANAFALRGARLRFADVDPGTFSMGAAEVAAALTPRTTTVVAVHYGGVARDPEALRDLCRERGLRLVEDNAHGLFGAHRGTPLGTFGALAALSFHATKNVSCGEGGALVVNDRALCARAELLREKGTDRSRFSRGEVDRYRWQAVGSSWLPSDLLAALLAAQLRHAAAMQARRHAVWATYRRLLEPAAGALGLVLQELPAGCAHPAHLFALLVPAGIDRDALLRGLAARAIRATSHYEPLHRAPAARDAARDQARLPVTDDVAARLVRLPLYADLPIADAERVAAALVAVVTDLGRTR